MATAFVKNLIAMLESRDAIWSSMDEVTQQISDGSHAAFQLEELTDSQQELSSAANRLNLKIKRMMATLQSKDPVTSKLLEKAKDDAFINKLLQLKAVKQRLHTKVMNHHFESERISRSVRGAVMGR